MPGDEKLDAEDKVDIDLILKMRAQDSLKNADVWVLERNATKDVFSKYPDLLANKKDATIKYIEKYYRQVQQEMHHAATGRKGTSGGHSNMRRKGPEQVHFASTNEGDPRTMRVDKKKAVLSPTPKPLQSVTTLSVVASPAFRGDLVLYTPKPDREIPDTVLAKGPFTNSAIIPPPPSGEKQSKTTLTRDVVHKWKGKNRKEFDSQKALFKVSAREHVISMPTLNTFPQVKAAEEDPELRKWEWLHLIAFSMGGDSDSESPQEARNIVAGTYACNSNMLCLETALKNFVEEHDATVRIVVDAKLYSYSHVAKSIVYRAFYRDSAGVDRKFELIFNNLTHLDPPIHSDAAFAAALKEKFLDPIKDLKVQGQALKPDPKATMPSKISSIPDTKAGYTPQTSSNYVVSNAFSPSKVKLPPIPPAKK